MKAVLYTIIALVAFAANSLFCRMALVKDYIDPWNFTLIRLLSAAICLGVIMAVHSYFIKYRHQKTQSFIINKVDSKASENKGSWISSFSLLIYATCLSLAYGQLDTGTGALILFSAVQLTMIGWGIYKKESLSVVQWGAFIVALLGFIYLMLPSATIPSLFSASLMLISGLAWGIYSIRGKNCTSPLHTTGYNFIRSLIATPVLIVLGISYLDSISIEGLSLAFASGAISSGIGYSIWYTAMPMLKSTQAAVVQLCVPIIAAFMGLIFLAEPLTLPFIIASIIILSSVFVFILSNKYET